MTHAVFVSINYERWKVFFLNPVSLGFIFLSIILLFPQVRAIQNNKRSQSRLIAGFQLACIIFAGFFPLYPNIILFRDLTSLSIEKVSAEPLVLRFLVYALVFGLLFILPGYFYLMKIFKSNSL